MWVVFLSAPGIREPEETPDLLKNKSQFFVHPSQPVLNKCSSCPCTKLMAQRN